MQIKSLFFYNNDGLIRDLNFNLGTVNIITGESKTGKTALIDIINYCLGSDDCRISEGVIRDTVDWFSILLQFKSEQVFIARQNPNRLNLASTEKIYFSNADNVEIPTIQKLVNNSDINTLKDFFTKKLLISEYSHNPETGTRDSLSVNFKHSRFYSFQPQYLIAQRDYLFFNQTDNFVPQAIKDTLPYFLGAIREDSYRIEQDIITRKRELNRLTRELTEYERLKSEGNSKVYELINEAKDLNLIELGVNPNDREAISILKELQNWENNSEEIIQGENENLKKLIDEKNSISKELSNLNDDIEAVSNFANQTSDYSSEAKQQISRLESINLFKDDENSHANCPLCNQTLNFELPAVTAIKNSLKSLTNNLTTTTLEKPKLAEYINKLYEIRENLKSEIQLRQNSIKAIYANNVQLNKQKDDNLRRGKVLGKISLFLESINIVSDDSSLKNKIKKLENEIEKLESLVSGEEKENRMNSILNIINTQMTEWEKLLDLEHQSSPIRFDIKKLTIFADTPKKSIQLSNMGSGANWVAFHLLIHFALHKYFIEAERPVPRFIIFDQPSQIYFPPEKDLKKTGKIELSSDEKAVRQMYDFIFKVTKELAPNLQVIITDHANLKYEEFNSAVIEEWRNGKKLIPNEWIE